MHDRNIRELLGSHIPEDEVKLLSNGRFTCLICTHRPIFDTINMVVVHRKGKKHVLELDKYLKRKEELEFVDMKKKQKLYIQAEARTKSVLGSGGKINKMAKLNRRPILELPSVDDNVNSFNSSGHLKRYLKILSKKPSFTDAVKKLKEYIPPNSSTSVSNFKVVDQNVLPTSTKISISNGSSFRHEMELKMSGWLKDSSGNWMKDPDAEFDSDEGDGPPPSASFVT
ncbi:sodium channel modifier 1-like isoform X2 [Lycorma delicatula]|uniref:sodium channel modifier 1-like isoform X2 n=1 Tax=Lycorma delicatula TaxID=130591 RepID=UPI003F5100B3